MFHNVLVALIGSLASAVLSSLLVLCLLQLNIEYPSNLPPVLYLILLGFIWSRCILELVQGCISNLDGFKLLSRLVNFNTGLILGTITGLVFDKIYDWLLLLTSSKLKDPEQLSTEMCHFALCWLLMYVATAMSVMVNCTLEYFSSMNTLKAKREERYFQKRLYILSNRVKFDVLEEIQKYIPLNVIRDYDPYANYFDLATFKKMKNRGHFNSPIQQTNDTFCSHRIDIYPR